MPVLRPVLRAAAVAALLVVAGTSAAQEKRPPRTVVLGFDGASADRVEALMKDGKLPNLAALAKRGGYSRLASSNPAQSPVAWASIVTGWNPGKTGIFDFLRRVPGKSPDAGPVVIDIGLAEARDEAPIPEGLRAALVFGAGAVGAAAGVGVVMALWAGGRRKRRPKGALTCTMTGVATLFAAAAYVVLAWIPLKVPTAHNLRSGEPFWSTGDKGRVRWTVLEAPLSFPADTMTCGCCLSGLGVPDARGTWGTYALWTDDAQSEGRLEMGGVAYFVKAGTKNFDLVLVGPRDPRRDRGAVDDADEAARRERYKREAALDWGPARRRESETAEEILKLADRATTRVAATLDAGKGARLVTAEGVAVDLVPGRWSDLVPVVFSISPIAKIHARTRFLLESAGAAPTATGDPWTPFRLLAEPMQFDPAALPPNVPLSSPRSFAPDLAKIAGSFETVGWPELTNPVKDDAISDRAFLDHLAIIRKGREARLKDRLARDDWDCLFAMFSEPDRVQHALYRHVDEKSPRHDPKTAAEFGPEIDRAYVEMDREVGLVVAAVGPDARIFVVSDHGFAPFRRGVNLNNFLVAKGFQVRRGEDSGQTLFSLQGGGEHFRGVDWSETKAYAMGLGNLYLNRVGREGRGIVKTADEEKTLAAIESALLDLRDKDGAKVVRHVYRGKDLYHGARAVDAPDLVVGFEWGYRVSWQTALGALDSDVIVDNPFRWSGDHCSVDPELVPGILFASVPLDPTAKPSVVDVAPSVLSLYGLVGPDPDGRSFLR